MLTDYLKKTLAARVYDVAIETPLQMASFYQSVQAIEFGLNVKTFSLCIRSNYAALTTKWCN